MCPFYADISFIRRLETMDAGISVHSRALSRIFQMSKVWSLNSLQNELGSLWKPLRETQKIRMNRPDQQVLDILLSIPIF